MGLKDWIAPFITLLIGASTIFISYKNYQAQAAAKPSELARLELWSKLLTEAGLDLNALPDPEKLTSDQRVILENYRVFLKRASLESKLRKVGIDSNRIFSLLMKRAHSSVKPTPIPIGDSVFYYRLILRGLLYIWVPLAVVFIGVPIVVVTIAYLIGLFPNHRGNLPDFALSPLAVVLLIVGAIAVGSLVYLQNRIISAIIANNVYFYFWDIYGSKKGARDSKDAYSERLAAKTYADQLFLGQQEFAQQFRENMYMAGIQEIDEYPRVLSDSVMLPHNYRVVKTREAEDPEDRIDRFVNWVRSKIGFERLEPRIIYTLEHKDAHKDAKKEAHGEPVATEQPVSGQSVSEQPAEAQDAQKAAEVPASEEPIVAEVPVEAPAEDPADAPTEPVTGGATDSSAAAGADDPTEAFTRIPEDAVDHESAGEKNAGEKPSTEKPKN
ncbi:CoA-disulfide reductase [Rothia sp. (in: high G+C Gram-positive bacteria)]|uniref:CoA-disulfide reductase n=1 Tax=Rothia sp. (in: high G+C Gram-positive bacteria) TaxID=1885016 RepID=UPI0025F2E839|nr:CoA-disulfide reductase [Rothia sp. (in: high G+C Gram-positive bacteria)]